MRVEITINEDKKCAECGKGGATGSGICLGCAVKALQGKPMRSREGKAVQVRLGGVKGRGSAGAMMGCLND